MLTNKEPIPAAAPALIAARGLMPRADRRKRVPFKQIMEKNRFISKQGKDLTDDAVQFGAAMQSYLAKCGSAAWTCGQVLDVLMALGFRHPERDFEICVHQFTKAIVTLRKRGLRKNRRRFPTWSEVLDTARKCGWSHEVEK